MRRLIVHLGMSALVLGLVLLPLGEGAFFGSEGDWISQHVGAAENLRQMILSTETIFPQYSAAGGGCNIYDYAYYGLYRPDVLLSCLFPSIEMKYFIAGYALLGIVLSVNLCYLWLKARHLPQGYALFSAMLMGCAACFFHAHHQIIFVNYLPFLILALMGIDRLLSHRGSGLMIFGLTMVCFHSFYYAPCCYIVCLLYGLEEIKGVNAESRRLVFGQAMINVVLSIGISCVLLLPTGLNILGIEKDAGSFMDEGLQVLDLSLEGLLFTPYGCGMTFLALVCLCIQMQRKSRRFIAGSILIAMAVPAVAWVLNGFLYARGKILIPFLPLIVWLCGDALAYLHEKFAERGVSLGWVKRTLPLLLIVPMITSLTVNGQEEYIAADDPRQSRFSQTEIKALTKDKRYRFDWLSNSFVNSNLLADGKTYKTAMYSSVYNSLYGVFYYDTMNNPISLRNRVVLMPNQNPCFAYFMGIRYLQCHNKQIPPGYQVVQEKDGYVLAENPDVLPIAYGTSDTLDAETYAQLDFPENMESLCRYTVVEGGQKTDYDSRIASLNPETVFSGTIKPGHGSLRLKQKVSDKIMVITFDVNDPKGKGVDITIDGVKNHLSSASAPYPNGNQHFTYVMRVKDDAEALSVEGSQGEWTIDDLQVFLMDASDLGLNEIYEVKETKEKDGQRMLACEVEMETKGYFVTSFPYRRGYQIFVDGEATAYELVNTAFVGFPLDAGMHQVEIRYLAPGFRGGLLLTCISIVCSIILGFRERKREK